MFSRAGATQVQPLAGAGQLSFPVARFATCEDVSYQHVMRISVVQGNGTNAAHSRHEYFSMH